jgi:bacterioferritin (cytochrome b1)
MLIKDIELENNATKRYAAQIERFKSYQDLVAILESVLRDEEDHAELFSTALARVQKTAHS